MLRKAEELNARAIDIRKRVASATKFNLAKLMRDLWAWTGGYLIHDGKTAKAVSSFIGCVAGQK